MKKIKFLAYLIVCSLLMASGLQAKWWIFGKERTKPEITSVYVSNINVDDVEEELILNKTCLNTEGKAEVKGFFSKSKSPVAKAFVSLDAGRTFKEAEIQKKNVFLFYFKPEEAEVYDMVFKIIDTAGNKNDENDIKRFKVKYKNVDATQLVKDAFDKLVENYELENLNSFMELVSENFRGDVFTLEDAVENDFNTYDSLDLNITINSVLQSGNEIIVNFEFEWQGVKTSTGELIKVPRDNSVYKFVLEGKNYKLIEMKKPIIFGVTKASEIASGEENTTTQESETELEKQETGSGGITAQQASFGDQQGIDFSTGNIIADMWGGDPNLDIGVNGNGLMGFNGAGIQELGPGTLDDYSSVPTSGYAPEIWNASAGNVYAVKTAEGNYAIFYIDALDMGNSIDITYKYQPDGSPDF